jgi:hypothetical protein
MPPRLEKRARQPGGRSFGRKRPVKGRQCRLCDSSAAAKIVELPPCPEADTGLRSPRLEITRHRTASSRRALARSRRFDRHRRRAGWRQIPHRLHRREGVRDHVFMTPRRQAGKGEVAWVWPWPMAGFTRAGRHSGRLLTLRTQTRTSASTSGSTSLTSCTVMPALTLGS